MAAPDTAGQHASARALMRAWITLLEAAVQQLPDASPETLTTITRDQTRLLEQWLALPATLAADDSLLTTLAERARLLHTQYQGALQMREQWNASRLQTLLAAAGAAAVYSPAGRVAPLGTSRPVFYSA